MTKCLVHIQHNIFVLVTDVFALLLDDALKSAAPLTSVFMVTRHFGHKTLWHEDTLGHFGTYLKTLRHQKRGTRHFDTSAVIEEKPGHFDPGQFR